MQKTYKLKGFSGTKQAAVIEKELKTLANVRHAFVDVLQKELVVDVKEDTKQQIQQSIIALDLGISPIEMGKTNAHEHSECGCHHTHVHTECGCHHTHEKTPPQKQHKNAAKIYVEGLDCANCASKMEHRINEMANVMDASINVARGIVFVTCKDRSKEEATLDAIIQAIPQIEKGVVARREQNKEKTDTKTAMFSIHANWRLYLGILLFIVALILQTKSYAVWIFLLAYVIAGGSVIIKAIKKIWHREMFDENFLMSVATIGAILIQSYEEAVAVMLFYEIGEMFQSYALRRSRGSIASLMDLRSDHANQLVDGKQIRVRPEDVAVGDIIVIKPGERVPLDGDVIQGEGTLDTSALTGESIPRDIQSGEEILAGVVNMSSVLHVRVRRVYEQSCVARILELVENASNKKAPMEKFITKFARIYTPIVVSLAILLVVIPMVFVQGAVLDVWLYRALTFLVVSCPCALIISVPLGLFAGIGAASRNGILVKGGNYLEALSKVDTVVFDKTGTLTKGVFALRHIYAQNSQPQEVLRIAAYAEYYSTHPIASSIKAAYAKDLDDKALSNYKEIAGQGICVQYEGEEVLAGNEVLLRAFHIPVAYEKEEEPGTIIHIAKGGSYMGYLRIADEIKETSKSAIKKLREMGVKHINMLSGDREAVGRYVAQALQLDAAYMELLPGDKVEKLEALLSKEKENHKLVFVGDGINDAPVLARADIGVAMGGMGSDAAIEAADVVLMRDDPYALATAMHISHATMNILWQNIIFSLGVKGVVLLLTAFGLTGMWMGVFADVGVTLIAILNSMRALRMK